MRTNALIFLKKFLKYKIPLWFFLVVLIIIIGAYIKGFTSGNSLLGSEKRSYSMVRYLTKVDEQVFLNAGITDIETETNNLKIPWTKIGVPYTEKKAIIILNYDAKLGIKKPISIHKEDSKNYTITIPEFEVIGVALSRKNPYKLYDKEGELLSIGTEDIDTGALAVNKLSNESQKEYLNQYKDLIRESAKNGSVAKF
ncbi:DUF4230 domain-containing protein [Lactococcus lactis]|uniref:DUF4230 domain-containing protein n=1 Tax=Lactococcus lactis TaxID=1358 RepID=UPI00117B2270|nr:DUF4230 domain-containing protein [Lactococcus lactis]TRW74405.1 phosphoribosylglycinamide synthetase [Lactococcus lactis]